MAYLKQRGNNWYAVWKDGARKIVKATGIPVKGKKEERLALQTALAMEAAAKGTSSLTRALDAVRSAAEALGMSSTNPPIDEYLTQFKPAGGASNAQNFKRAISLFLDYLGAEKHMRIDRLSPARCRSYFLERLKQVAYGTAKINLAHLRCAFNAAVRDGMLDRNPFNSFKLAALAPANMPRAVKRLPFTPQELNTIITSFPAPYNELALASLLTGGQRIGDVCCLRWDSIDFTNKIIHLRTAKTGKEITAPIHPRLEQLLRQHKDNGSEYVFPDAQRKYSRSKGSVSVEFTMLLKAHGITTSSQGTHKAVAQKSFHSIRHTVVSLLRSSNRFTADTARDIVGHDSEEIERAYFTADYDSKAQGINYLFDSVTKSDNAQ